jgi:hypothetical protein
MVADVLSVDRVVEAELSWAARSLRRRSVRGKNGRIFGKTIEPLCPISATKARNNDNDGKMNKYHGLDQSLLLRLIITEDCSNKT